MTSIAYLSHPLGSSHGDSDELVQHYDNISNAGEWLGFLIEHTRWALMCPWLAYMRAARYGELHRPRALVDQIRLLERSDFVVQVGGWTSPHMEIERNHAARNDMPVVDLTRFGFTPPVAANEVQQVLDTIKENLVAIRRAKPRRVWLPPLSDSDVEALRAAQIVLRQDPFSQEAALAIERIVQAALRTA